MQTQLPVYRLINAVGNVASPLGTSKALSILFGGAFLGFVFAIFVLATLLQVFNYDAVPYVASALQLSGLSNEAVHQQAWGAIQSATSQADYEALSNGDAYRARQSSDANAFASVLPLYSVKLGYSYLLSFAQDAKAMVTLASWTSHISALVLGLTSFFWMYRTRSLQGGALVAAFFLLMNYFELSRAIGPDIVANAITLIGLYLWLQKRVWISMVVLFAALLFRPDTVILLFALVLVSFLFKTEKWPALLTFVCGLAVSIWVQKTMGHPGWWTHYYFSNVTIQPTLEGFEPAFSIFAWAKGFARGVFMSVVNFNWAAIFATLLVGLAALVKATAPFTQRQAALITTCILTIGGKFLVFPLPDSRMYLVFLLAILLTCLSALKPDFAWSKTTIQA